MSAPNLSYYSFVTKLQQRASLREIGVASGLHGEEGRHPLHGDHALRRASCKDVVLELGLQHSRLHGNHSLKWFHPFEPEHSQKKTKRKKQTLKGSIISRLMDSSPVSSSSVHIFPMTPSLTYPIISMAMSCFVSWSLRCCVK